MILWERDAPAGHPGQPAYNCMLSYSIVVSHLSFNFLCLLLLYSIFFCVRDHIEDHKRDKAHREDRLIKNKQHQPSVHYERISIQWETHIWLKNILGFYFIIQLHLQVLGFLPILTKHLWLLLNLFAQFLYFFFKVVIHTCSKKCWNYLFGILGD